MPEIAVTLTHLRMAMLRARTRRLDESFRSSRSRTLSENADCCAVRDGTSALRTGDSSPNRRRITRSRTRSEARARIAAHQAMP